MTPELPIEMPDMSKILEAANLREAPCSMIRCDVQCSNLTDKGMMYPAGNGTYAMVFMCDMCLEELP